MNFKHFFLVVLLFFPSNNAYAYFHFHPSVTITKTKNSFWKIEMPMRQQVFLKVKIGEPVIEEGYYSPEFGKKFSSLCLKVSLDKTEGGCVQILWDNKNE